MTSTESQEQIAGSSRQRAKRKEQSARRKSTDHTTKDYRAISKLAAVSGEQKAVNSKQEEESNMRFAPAALRLAFNVEC